MNITKPYTVNTTSQQKVKCEISSEKECCLKGQEKIDCCLKETWAKWLNGYSWEWFVTLTFRHRQSRQGADRKWYKWLRKLENELGEQIGYFRCSEIQKTRNAIHFHALLLNITKLERYDYNNYFRAKQYYKKKKIDPTEEQLRQLAIRFYWNDQWYEIAGIGRVLPYEKAASGYLSKYVKKELRELSDYKFGGLVLKT